MIPVGFLKRASIRIDEKAAWQLKAIGKALGNLNLGAVVRMACNAFIRQRKGGK